MNTNQYTQKTLEALQAAQQLAVENPHNAMEPEHLLEEMKALVDEEIEGKEELSAGQMMDIVRGMREALQSGSRPFPAERPPEDRGAGM